MTYYDIIKSLKPNSIIMSDNYCHLDPDLRAGVRNREYGWKPAFGQMSSSLTLLRNQKVSIGDIFLYFGWFKATEIINGRLVYKKHAPDLHIIYGYLQVGAIIEKKSDIPDWLKTHPHASYDDSWRKGRNAIFLPSDHLSFQNDLKGSGVLDYRLDRVLTKSGYSRGCWDLPSFFKDVYITCNPNPWKDAYFKHTAAKKRGQIAAEQKCIRPCHIYVVFFRSVQAIQGLLERIAKLYFIDEQIIVLPRFIRLFYKFL